MNNITNKTFAGTDRGDKIREAIEAGYDKDYITNCVYEQQRKDREGYLKKEECKQMVYKIAYNLYMKKLKEAQGGAMC